MLTPASRQFLLTCSSPSSSDRFANARSTPSPVLQALYTQSHARFSAYVNAGVLLNNYAHIFDLLTRLRQVRVLGRGWERGRGKGRGSKHGRIRISDSVATAWYEGAGVLPPLGTSQWLHPVL